MLENNGTGMIACITTMPRNPELVVQFFERMLFERDHFIPGAYRLDGVNFACDGEMGVSRKRGGNESKRGDYMPFNYEAADLAFGIEASQASAVSQPIPIRSKGL